MKKIYYLVLCLLFVSAANLNAQVTIGENRDPHQSAILDLNTNSSTVKKGFLLPQVELTASNTWGLDGSAIAGMMVFNKKAVTNLPVGAYVWDGTKWNSAGVTAPIDPNLPTPPSDWITTANSGSGTLSAPYSNSCPATTVVLTTQSGYTFGKITPTTAASLSDGTLTFNASGNVVVTKGDQSGTVYVTISNCNIPVTSITIAGAISVQVGKTITLTKTIQPSGATNKTVTWSVTNNTGSATINSSTGELTGVIEGTVSVIATATDGSGVSSSPRTITVNPLSVASGVYEQTTTGYLTELPSMSDAATTKTYFRATGKTLYLAAKDLLQDGSQYMKWDYGNTACLADGRRLPTLYELGQLQDTLSSYNLLNRSYWTSTERNATMTWSWNFNNSYSAFLNIDSPLGVRCVWNN